MDLTEKEETLISQLDAGWIKLRGMTSAQCYSVSLAIKRLGIKKERAELAEQQKQKEGI